MSMDLYYFSLSAPCRAVMMTAKLVGVELNVKTVNLQTGEQFKPEFLELNPLHTVPLFKENNLKLSESRAICAYLVNKYAKSDQLYPKSPKERALVDQYLYFDISLYKNFMNYYYSVIFFGEKKLDHTKKKDMDNSFGFLNSVLSKTKYIAGDHLTIADLAAVASASTMEAVDKNMFKDYPKIKEWLERCKNEIPDYQTLNQEGVDMFGHVAQAALAKIN